MSQNILIIVGACISLLWGAAHLFSTKSVVKGFGDITPENRHIITMEWISEGLSLIFIGALPLFVLFFSPAGEFSRTIVFRACSAMLFVMAALTAATGSRTSIIPIKICPIIKSIAAGLILYGSFS